ncbi:cytochrome c biogenesis protein transmembrane region [Thermobaculum terrenum ATCC BAA-798]|uniref:Cytochrome c biogenesis protein transmembrane region n=1 Tax=Thermobaculum terrenum (strain ATCC BAA-798 / CCMEE 7001 / YNP1) TaxID=525904 RepID=D1CHP0_THET1|nr:cytochrome c biogenesis CcdA family protein [Thermobaculum terrenum]ACZ43261.1 cytochrome c biogenesis protein transmembrane region [Thermobaculum terrenum ATCC BAA-798]
MRAFGVDQRREQYGLIASLLVLIVALAAAIATGNRFSQVTGGVEAIAFSWSRLISSLGSALPLGYAFVAGMVAAVNPCGFALLPAYLAYYLGDDTKRKGAQLGRALGISAMVTLGFVLLFGTMGVVLAAVTTSVAGVFPWVGLIVGIALVFLGGRMLGGHMVYSSLGERVADRIGSRARGRNLGAYFLYGLAYGACSLGCTLPIFLIVVGGTLSAGDLVRGLWQFVSYALGMGAVLAALTLAAAVLSSTAIRRVRTLSRWVQPASAVLLLLAGGYIVYYWLTLGGLL